METLFKLLTLLTISVTVTACTAGGSITELDPISSTLSKTSNAEIVVGSNQSSKTSANYKVQSSVGHKIDQLTIKTAGGYKVYQSVQGELVVEGTRQ